MITEKGKILFLIVFAISAFNGILSASLDSNELLMEFAEMYKECLKAGDYPSAHLANFAKEAMKITLFSNVLREDIPKLTPVYKKVLKQISCICWTIGQGYADADKNRKMVAISLYVGWLCLYYANFVNMQAEKYAGETRVTFTAKKKMIKGVLDFVGWYLAAMGYYVPFNDIFEKLKHENMIVDANIGPAELSEMIQDINKFLEQLLPDYVFPSSVPSILCDEVYESLVEDISRNLSQIYRAPSPGSEECEIILIIQLIKTKLEEFAARAGSSDVKT